MKKVFFAAALIGLMLASCGDDDNAVTNVAVEGNWKLTGITLDQAYDLNANGATSTNLMSETGCFNNTTMILANNTAVLTAQDVEISSESTGTGIVLMADCLPAEVFTGSYTVTNDHVIVGTGEDPLTFNRFGNTLSFHTDAAISVPLSGTTNWTDVGGTYTFTKQ